MTVSMTGKCARPDALTARRQNWPAKQWRTSENGNLFLNTRGFNIVVFSSRKGWGIKIEQRYGDRCQFGKQRFKTAAEAKARAFDALEWAAKRMGSGRYDFAASQGASNHD